MHRVLRLTKVLACGEEKEVFLRSDKIIALQELKNDVLDPRKVNNYVVTAAGWIKVKQPIAWIVRKSGGRII